MLWGMASGPIACCYQSSWLAPYTFPQQGDAQASLYPLPRYFRARYVWREKVVPGLETAQCRSCH
jgi:hypothetical protein